MNERRIDVEEALNALEHMDDFARMADIDPIGPRNILLTFIEQVRNDRADKGAGDVELPPLPAPPDWTITGAEQRNQLCEWATKYARDAVLDDRQRGGDTSKHAYREAVAHLETLAAFGGTLTQARELAAKGVERSATLAVNKTNTRTEWNTAWLTRNEGETK